MRDHFLLAEEAASNTPLYQLIFFSIIQRRSNVLTVVKCSCGQKIQCIGQIHLHSKLNSLVISPAIALKLDITIPQMFIFIIESAKHILQYPMSFPCDLKAFSTADSYWVMFTQLSQTVYLARYCWHTGPQLPQASFSNSSAKAGIQNNITNKQEQVTQCILYYVQNITVKIPNVTQGIVVTM